MSTASRRSPERHCTPRSIPPRFVFGSLPNSTILARIPTNQKVYTTFTRGVRATRYRSIVMYARIFKKAGEERRFTITNAGELGWEVREEQGSRIVWRRRYTDWHRVERARMSFATQALALTSEGWKES